MLLHIQQVFIHIIWVPTSKVFTSCRLSHTKSPISIAPDLLKLVKETHAVLQQVDPTLDKDCWLCVLITALSYQALGLIPDASRFNVTRSLLVRLYASPAQIMGNITCFLGYGDAQNVSANHTSMT